MERLGSTRHVEIEGGTLKSEEAQLLTFLDHRLKTKLGKIEKAA